MNRVGKAEHADRIPLRERDVGHHQRRIEGVIQQGVSGALIDHHPPAIKQKDHTLALVVLKLPNGQLATASRASPIDVAVIIVSRCNHEAVRIRCPGQYALSYERRSD